MGEYDGSENSTAPWEGHIRQHVATNILAGKAPRQ